MRFTQPEPGPIATMQFQMAQASSTSHSSHGALLHFQYVPSILKIYIRVYRYSKVAWDMSMPFLTKHANSVAKCCSDMHLYMLLTSIRPRQMPVTFLLKYGTTVIPGVLMDLCGAASHPNNSKCIPFLLRVPVLEYTPPQFLHPWPAHIQVWQAFQQDRSLYETSRVINHLPKPFRLTLFAFFLS